MKRVFHCRATRSGFDTITDGGIGRGQGQIGTSPSPAPVKFRSKLRYDPRDPGRLLPTEPFRIPLMIVSPESSTPCFSCSLLSSPATGRAAQHEQQISKTRRETRTSKWTLIFTVHPGDQSQGLIRIVHVGCRSAHQPTSPTELHLKLFGRRVFVIRNSLVTVGILWSCKG